MEKSLDASRAPLALLARLKENLSAVIRGKEEAINQVLVAMLADGHVLIEDVPGTGKTTLAKALAVSLAARFSRVQFTPDLLPTDIVGGMIYSAANGSFTFRPGPIFAHIVLADEINRASPRTQSALLEAMNENQTTIEGQCRPLARPFMVIATENPIEFHGTYPLPEAQLDRFLVRLAIGYPTAEVEVDILKSHANREPLDSIEPVMGLDQVRAIQEEVANVHVDDAILEYIVEIVHATRNDSRLQLGVSTRGTLMLSRAARARAYALNRAFVIPDDVSWSLPHVLPHRLLLTAKAQHGGATAQQIVAEILGRIKVPV